MSSLHPFEIRTDATALRDIRRRVEEYPWAALPDATQGRRAASREFLRRLSDRWVGGYDWSDAEQQLRRFPSFRAEVGGIDLHVVVEAGSGRAPGTLLLIHGWPGSVWEFWEVIDRLAHPERFGGDAESGMTVVLPSLPGYGWSDPPREPQGRRADAALMHELMTQVLGVERYVAAGGDWGGFISGWLAADHPEALRGIYITNALLRPHGAGRGQTRPDDYTAEERRWLDDEAVSSAGPLAYVPFQARNWQMLAAALNGNPMGQAAWILDKYHLWTDPDDGRDPDAFYGMDRLITQVMIYVTTGTFATSLWPYAGLGGDPPSLAPGQRIEVPTGIGDFADPLIPLLPPSILERAFDVVHRFESPSGGGHFAAFAAPEAFAADLRRFLSGLAGWAPGPTPSG
jgi:pimeloyl-ACP methyl ester carboxylesterase